MKLIIAPFKASRAAMAVALLMMLSSGNALADTAGVSIDKSVHSGDRFQVSTESGFEVINGLDHRIGNIHVIAAQGGKKLISVRELLPGQSLNFAFSRAGVYALCYAPGQVGDSVKTCLEINVVKRLPA
jgi:hypothetical protein